MSSRIKLFFLSVAIAVIGLFSLTACGPSIDHEQATPLTHETSLASNVPHDDPINTLITGGAEGEYMSISCPSGTESKNFHTKTVEAEFEAADGGLYISFEGNIPVAIIVQADDRGKVIYYPQTAVSFISAADLDRIATPENFTERIANYCLAIP